MKALVSIARIFGWIVVVVLSFTAGCCEAVAGWLIVAAESLAQWIGDRE